MYKGFELFNDIEDNDLRIRNRAVVLTNMACDNMNRATRRITEKGAMLMLGYFNQIPMEERKAVTLKFAEDMKHRGFILAH